ncbi:hypothetical protein EBT31_19410 [bacterium]|jgi:quercetin dioxygenase-like cupin family protein|nr:hypothetical protein [bacterium]
MIHTMILPKHDFTIGGLTMRVFHANRGEGLPKHQHTFSHIAVCNAGSCVVRNERRSLIMTKDTQPVNLVANEWHEIEALEDGTVFVNAFAGDKY